jgi:hypothetical protein
VFDNCVGSAGVHRVRKVACAFTHQVAVAEAELDITQTRRTLRS